MRWRAVGERLEQEAEPLASLLGVDAEQREDPFLQLGLVGMGLFHVTVGLLVPGWLALVGELFPERMRARALGITFVFNRAGALCGGFVARAVLSASWMSSSRKYIGYSVTSKLSSNSTER